MLLTAYTLHIIYIYILSLINYLYILPAIVTIYKKNFDEITHLIKLVDPYNNIDNDEQEYENYKKSMKDDYLSRGT